MIGEGAIEDAVKGRLRTGEGGQMFPEEAVLRMLLDVACEGTTFVSIASCMVCALLFVLQVARAAEQWLQCTLPSW